MEIDELKTALAERDAAITKRLTKLDRLEEGNAALLERIEGIEAKAANPKKTAGDSADTEHKTRFEAWLRKPTDPRAITALGEFQDQLSRKDMSIGSDPNGGFAVPQQIAADIERLELKLSPVRRLVKVVQAGTSDFHHIVSDTDDDDSPAAPGIRADSLIDLVYSVNSSYRANANWVMNSATAGAIRKLKTADGRYVWTDSLASGQPAMLLGYGVEIWEQMPDVGVDNFPVAFGDFRRGYLLMDRVGLRITRDEVTTPGLTKFYVRRREGGRPLNNDAVKFLRTIQ